MEAVDKFSFEIEAKQVSHSIPSSGGCEELKQDMEALRQKVANGEQLTNLVDTLCFEIKEKNVGHSTPCHEN
jgi:hypothetical protein